MAVSQRHRPDGLVTTSKRQNAFLRYIHATDFSSKRTPDSFHSNSSPVPAHRRLPDADGPVHTGRNPLMGISLGRWNLIQCENHPAVTVRNFNWFTDLQHICTANVSSVKGDMTLN